MINNGTYTILSPQEPPLTVEAPILLRRAYCPREAQYTTVDGPKSCMTLRTLNYGNYGIFLIMGHAGFCPSAVV